MFPIWLILGVLLILAGLFNRQVLSFLDIKPMSDVFITPNLAQSTRLIEKIGRWLVMTLGISFLVQGLNGVLPNDFSSTISFLLLGLIGLMIFAIVGITIKNWKAK